MTKNGDYVLYGEAFEKDIKEAVIDIGKLIYRRLQHRNVFSRFAVLLIQDLYNSSWGRRALQGVKNLSTYFNDEAINIGFESIDKRTSAC